MKKIFICLLIGLLLFSGCSKENNAESIDLTDFTYEYQNNSKRIKIVANFDIEDLEITYHLLDGSYLITEVGTLKCGTLEQDKIYYFSIINQFERDFNNLEVVSATGKTDKPINAAERNARLDDIIFYNQIISENNIMYFVVIPKIDITNFSITYGLRKGFGSFKWRFTNTLQEVTAETEYRIEIPIFDEEIDSAIDFLVTGTVKL